MTSLVMTMGSALTTTLADFAAARRIVFLANDTRGLAALRRRLGDAAAQSVLLPGDRLNRIAAEIAPEIVNLDAQLVAEDRLPMWWLASNTGDRGPYATRLLPLAAKAVLALELLDGDAPCLLIVDDIETADTLARLAVRNGRSLAVAGRGASPQRWLSAITRHVRKARVLTSEIRQGLHRYVALRRFRARHPFPAEAVRTARTLVCTWTDASTFRKGVPLAHERYLGRIPAILRAAEPRQLHLALPISWVEPYETILASAAGAPDGIVFPEDFLTLSDTLRSLAWPFRVMRRIGRRLKIAGHDLSDILALEIAREAETMAAAGAARFANVAYGLARAGCRPQAVVCPYENQPWEKVLRAGLRAFVPGVSWTGYFHPPHRDMYLSFLPSRRDIAEGDLPDRLIVLGDAAASFFITGGVPKDRVQVGGAVRYEALMSKPFVPSHKVPADGTITLLCATTIEHDASAELALKAAEAARLDGACRLVVNFHPTADAGFRDLVRASLDDSRFAGTEIVFSTDNAAILVGQADVVLYNNSASCIEALAAGRPVVFVHRDADIDFDCLPDGLAIRCRTPADIAGALRRLRADAGRLDAVAVKDRLSAILGTVRPEQFEAAIGPGPARPDNASDALTGGTCA